MWFTAEEILILKVNRFYKKCRKLSIDGKAASVQQDEL
jgi:hypothetical protein